MSSSELAVPNHYTVTSFKSVANIRLLKTFSTNQFIFDNDDMKYIEYARQFSEFCNVHLLFRRCGNKKDLVGITIDALQLGVLRTIWAKSLPLKRINLIIEKHPLCFSN